MLRPGAFASGHFCFWPIHPPCPLLSFRAAFGEESVIGDWDAAGLQQIPPFGRNDKVWGGAGDGGKFNSSVVIPSRLLARNLLLGSIMLRANSRFLPSVGMTRLIGEWMARL
jgi:hypothetical protein